MKSSVGVFVGKACSTVWQPARPGTGNLISVPEEQEEFGGVDKSCLGFKPAKFDIWRSMLFVHPDPDAPSLAQSSPSATI